MYPPIIGLTGKRGAGKDTAARLIEKLTSGAYCQKLYFADSIKWMAQPLTGLPLAELYTQEGKATFLPELGMSVGELFQRLGQALRDSLHADVWVIDTMAKVLPGKCTLIPDVRYPNEARAILARGGVVLRVLGDPLQQQGDGTRDDRHPSETALDETEFPVLYNTSTELSLRAQLSNALRRLRAGQKLTLPSQRQPEPFHQPFTY